MKVIQSRTPANYFFGVRVRKPFYFASTRTPGHLILGVLAKFSDVPVYYSRTVVNGNSDWNGFIRFISGIERDGMEIHEMPTSPLQHGQLHSCIT